MLPRHLRKREQARRRSGRARARAGFYLRPRQWRRVESSRRSPPGNQLEAREESLILALPLAVTRRGRKVSPRPSSGPMPTRSSPRVENKSTTSSRGSCRPSSSSSSLRRRRQQQLQQPKLRPPSAGSVAPAYSSSSEQPRLRSLHQPRPRQNSFTSPYRPLRRTRPAAPARPPKKVLSRWRLDRARRATTPFSLPRTSNRL